MRIVIAVGYGKTQTVLIEAPKGAWNIVDLGIVKRNFQEAANELGADWRWETAAE